MLICQQKCYLKYKLFGFFLVKIISISDEKFFSETFVGCTASYFVKIMKFLFLHGVFSRKFSRSKVRKSPRQLYVLIMAPKIAKIKFLECAQNNYAQKIFMYPIHKLKEQYMYIFPK